MENDRLFTINEFARYARTTSETLRHYDRIGLLQPITRGANNYRYYSCRQLAVVNVIRTLRGFGMTLGEIKEIRDSRCSSLVDELFERQVERIDQKIEGWLRAQKLIYTLRKTIHSVSSVDEGGIVVLSLPAEPIALGGQNDYSQGRNQYDALLSFYQAMKKKHPEMDLNYPVWGCYSLERIKKRDWIWPDRFYFYNPEGRDKRPAGLYAIGYARGGYGMCGGLLDRLVAYTQEHGLEICGNAYEEYPINELCAADGGNYLIRVMIAVRKNQA